MPSIIQGFNSDIFISYRKNDRIYGWVEEFAARLIQELDVNVKEKLSVYYKKKGMDDECGDELILQQPLLFMPVICEQYIDENSNEWNDEFLQFIKTEKSNALPLTVILENGIRASRILPVRIAKIADAKIKQLEEHLSGNLKSMEFIYDALEGVSRPLRNIDDDLAGRTGGLSFRKQMNTTAITIAGLVKGVKAHHPIFPAAVPAAPPPEKNIVFISWPPDDCKGRYEEIKRMFQQANFNVLPYIDLPSDENRFKASTIEYINKADCSIHLLGKEIGKKFASEGSLPFIKYQFEIAKNKLLVNGKFKMFMWNCPVANAKETDSDMKEFINFIRYSIGPNMIFTNVASSVQLVDDIRGTFLVEEKPVLPLHDTEVFFISNVIDEFFSKGIIDMLNDVVHVEFLNIGASDDIDYEQYSVQQTKKSKLTTVFFSEASNWAIPFTQQLWKLTGGASSPTPLLLLGDEQNEANIGKYFNAPKVISKIVNREIVPVEVKYNYDKIVNAVI